MIHYTLEHSSQSEPIVATEGSRESDDRNRVREFRRAEIYIWMTNVRVEMREYLAIT